eukprot:SM000242S08483  [mRNA]  locus=s242:164261:167142:+ [translate_table: standard]
MYEGSFFKLSERYFKQTAWPPVEVIAPYVDNDHVFCLLYKEMYFRHLYKQLAPTLEQRCESWDNYTQLFQVILHGHLNMQLPNQWLWDMIDEFIYQFQAFCQFRAKAKARSDAELLLLREADQVWNVFGVLNYLQALIDKSDIVQILDSERGGELTFSVTDGYDYEGGGSNVLTVLGYFSIVGLLRMHCILGDYHTALARVTPIDVSQPSATFTRTMGCHITMLYYYGFASLMMRRYTDAITAVNRVLLYIIRNKQYLQASPQMDQILKKNEQLYALLAICISLCPQNKLVEESVSTALREKYADKMTRMQRGDESVFDELFSYSCPKFITPSPPNYEEALVNYNQDAYRLQLKLFLAEVRQQQLLPNIRSFLNLYTSIPLAKLASFMDIDDATLRTALMTYKHKNHVVDADGDYTNAAIDFYIDEDMVHVAEPKSTRRFGDYFIRHIAKARHCGVACDEIVGDLRRTKRPS